MSRFRDERCTWRVFRQVAGIKRDHRLVSASSYREAGATVGAAGSAEDATPLMTLSPPQ